MAEDSKAAAAADEAPKPAAEEPKPEKKPWWRRFRPNLAISAFAMSLTHHPDQRLLLGPGPNIVVLPPEQMLLYRDGEGDKAVLSMAMQLDMINSASGDYGDVMLDASIQPDEPAARNSAIRRWCIRCSPIPPQPRANAPSARAA